MGGKYRIPVVSLKGSGQRVRLTSLGDGVNRVLTIILSLLNCKDGVLLLDEFETGLHYSVQKQLWEVIFMLAEQLNVQVFVTTHSSDCLSAFSKVNVEGQGMLIRLEQRKNEIVPVCYIDNKDIAFAAENNIELR
jgi:AAA15 family ATPase/GTPase